MTLTWNGKQIDWVNVGWFGAIHAGALLAPWTFTWTGLAVALGLWWLVGSIGICLTYHRLLTHRGFTLWKPLEYVFTLGGDAGERGRRHHLGGDAPHAPRDVRPAGQAIRTRRRTASCGATSAGS